MENAIGKTFGTMNVGFGVDLRLIIGDSNGAIVIDLCPMIGSRFDRAQIKSIYDNRYS